MNLPARPSESVENDPEGDVRRPPYSLQNLQSAQRDYGDGGSYVWSRGTYRRKEFQ
jgi:hypothetical protein